MEQVAPVYGEDRRRLRVLKLRGVKFRGGYHDIAIKTGGLEVYPRLIAAEHHAELELAQLKGQVGAGGAASPALDAAPVAEEADVVADGEAAPATNSDMFSLDKGSDA